MKTKKRNYKLILSLMVVLGALFLSCNENEDLDDSAGNNNNQTGVTQSTLDQGASIQKDFTGRIVNESSMPLDNVFIDIGSKTTITDSNGVFIIKDATVKERQAFIIAEKSGYLKGLRSVVPIQGTNNISIMLVAENLAGTVASGTNSDVTLSNGAKVSFDGEFEDENGNAYSGNVDVYMYYLDPTNASIDAIMPGDLQAENENGDERVLVTYGMLNVELKDDSGQKLNIADGHVAEIEVPLNPAQTGTAPSTIPLWHFDEVAGHWLEEGEATIVGGKYVGEVSHFSWWNYDAPFPSVQFCLTVLDGSSIPLSNVKIELWASAAISGKTAYTGGNGEICGRIPSNETFTLFAFDPCGTQVYTTTITTVTSDINFGNIILSGVTAEVILGNLIDCTYANNVTNGYVSLTYGSEFASMDVNNGAFSMSVIKCATLDTFSLEGVDYNTFDTTTVLPFNFSNTNIGNIVACNAVTEYISVQVDNDPVAFYLTNINANLNSGNGHVQIGAQASNGSTILLDGNSAALNTYSSLDFGIESTGTLINMNIFAANTLEYTITGFGAVGGYIDMTIAGTYTDNNGNTRNLTATLHVIRDN